MGLIGTLVGKGAAGGLAGAARDVAEVFTPNATRKMELSHEAYAAALAASSEEFRQPKSGVFDNFVNGLNRLPRPLLALGTLGLFGYSMADPAGFGLRMQGLGEVPEPLWWLLGAIVSFYFGAREAYYFRGARSLPKPKGKAVETPSVPSAVPKTAEAATPGPDGNAALDEWRAQRRG